MNDYGEMTSDIKPRTRRDFGTVFLWVLWHRLRGHYVQPNGWLCHGGKSTRIWRCVLPCREERVGRAPNWLRWREQG